MVGPFYAETSKEKASAPTVYSLSLRTSHLVLSYTRLTSLKEMFYFQLQFLFFCSGDKIMVIAI